MIRNGDPNGYAGCVNLSFAYVEGESLLMALKVRGQLLFCEVRIRSDGSDLIYDASVRICSSGSLAVLLSTSQDIALSSGSACTSASLEPSYVLRALGAAEDMAHSSLRFGIGRFTTEAEIDLVVERIVGTVNKLRDMSPLWEMVQEGIDINTIQWSQ